MPSQHCVVDTSDGRIVLPPTTDEEQAEDLAARLNARDGSSRRDREGVNQNDDE
jgi:hypothetical protein